MSWSIPKTMWPGRTCAILASGPSMSEAVAEAVRYAPYPKVIAINNTFKLAPWADMLYAADREWWGIFKSNKWSFDGLKVTCTDPKVPLNMTDPEVLEVGIGPQEGFSDDPSKIATGGNSGYQAICIAAHAGCKRILLCGFDMKPGHWHAEHESPLRKTGAERYTAWIERFKTLAPPLAARDIEVINCTPDSALKVWKYIPLEQALNPPGG